MKELALSKLPMNCFADIKFQSRSNSFPNYNLMPQFISNDGFHAGPDVSIEVDGEVIAVIGNDKYVIGNTEDLDDLLNQSPKTTESNSFNFSYPSCIPTTVTTDVSDDEPTTSSSSPRTSTEFRPRQSGNKRLWEFLLEVLKSKDYNPSHIKWINRMKGEFRIVRSTDLARMWGEIKNNEGMTYEKMSRAMRYYYKRQILAPVLNKRLVYKFGPKATGW